MDRHPIIILLLVQYVVCWIIYNKKNMKTLNRKLEQYYTNEAMGKSTIDIERDIRFAKANMIMPIDTMLTGETELAYIHFLRLTAANSSMLLSYSKGVDADIVIPIILIGFVAQKLLGLHVGYSPLFDEKAKLKTEAKITNQPLSEVRNADVYHILADINSIMNKFSSYNGKRDASNKNKSVDDIYGILLSISNKINLSFEDEYVGKYMGAYIKENLCKSEAAFIINGLLDISKDSEKMDLLDSPNMASMRKNIIIKLNEIDIDLKRHYDNVKNTKENEKMIEIISMFSPEYDIEKEKTEE